MTRAAEKCLVSEISPFDVNRSDEAAGTALDQVRVWIIERFYDWSDRGPVSSSIDGGGGAAATSRPWRSRTCL